MNQSEEEILRLLENVFDPEIPVLNIVEMGIVRSVNNVQNEYRIEITPTYSGCPAMHTIEKDILDLLNSHGIKNVKIKRIYSPAWTTDCFSESTKTKLKEYGIAPPVINIKEEFLKINRTCPFCDSDKTKTISEFGSTSCKSLHYCDDCRQPFEYFKCI